MALMNNSNLKHYRRVPNFIHRVIGGKHILVSVGENIANFNGYIQLNDTAAFLWEQLSEPCTLEELCSRLCKEYTVSKETAEADIKEMLNNGIQNGMVVQDG